MVRALAWLQYVLRDLRHDLSGTYSISASGYGFLSNPLSPTDSVYGLVSQQGGQNIFVGSSTESGLNDMFVAAPYSSSATNATFKGSY